MRNRPTEYKEGDIIRRHHCPELDHHMMIVVGVWEEYDSYFVMSNFVNSGPYLHSINYLEDDWEKR